MTLTSKQIAFKTTPVFQWNYEARARVVVNQGGSSSGKTYSILQVLLLRLMERPNLVCTVVGQDIPNLKKGALRDVERIFSDCPDLARFVVSQNKTDRVFNLSNGSVMEFTSYKDEQDAKSGKRDYLFVNEANGVQWEIYNQLAMRTATQIFIDYNPTAAFWAHTKLQGQPDTVFFYSRYTHNPFVHPAIVAHIEAYKQSDPESWRVYGLGKTGAIQGLVFPSVTIVPELPKHYRKRAYGLDFGFNHPTACALVQETEGELFLHEIMYAYEQSNKQIADALKAAWVRDSIVWCDSAEPRTIAELKVLGINAQPARKGPDSITAGIKLMKGFKRINITADSTNARKEQQNYKYKSKDGGYLDEPVDSFNHFFDSTRYACTMTWGKLGALPGML